MSNIGGSEGKADKFLSNLLRRLERLENSLGVIGGKITRTVEARQRVFVGPTNPLTSLPAETEYVWFRTDGNGNLMQTVVGKSPSAG